MSTRSHEQQIGDERLREATGRSRVEWYALLDEAGAREWDHTRIARWLGGEHDVDGWWAQGVTVGYEQSRGLREPGQRPDGTFEVSATKTIYGAVADIWPYLADDELRRDWLDVDWKLVGTTEPKTVRLVADDDSRVLLSLDPLAPGKDGRTKARVGAAHSRLPGADAVGETKKFWRDALAKLAALLNP
ncbi:hypothetical protein [Georgenia subflava]|uniref:DUF4287 domain-containing protein n=1 Tax=Georgenia subflava TaxID=1622177 RepID=A0A6N7EKT6_9MICO|nr:hypothetical protein [Georgenia subflava]MPV37427.1 hypothetical protein [Georgenia subflava]